MKPIKPVGDFIVCKVVKSIEKLPPVLDETIIHSRKPLAPKQFKEEAIINKGDTIKPNEYSQKEG